LNRHGCHKKNSNGRVATGGIQLPPKKYLSRHGCLRGIQFPPDFELSHKTCTCVLSVLFSTITMNITNTALFFVYSNTALCLGRTITKLSRAPSPHCHSGSQTRYQIYDQFYSRVGITSAHLNSPILRQFSPYTRYLQ
jgi:hypothetical protein